MENDKCKLNKGIQSLLEEIEKEMKVRLETFYPEGFNLCGNMDKLKLQTNDQKLANYGRGTVFDIPENIRFIRTSSYWDINVGSFLDNTWNFFDFLETPNLWLRCRKRFFVQKNYPHISGS